MKLCPQCRSQFNDSLQFCLNDGTLLIDDTDQETVFFPNRVNQIKAGPPTSQSQTFLKYLLPALFVFLTALGLFAFLWWKQNGQNQTTASVATDNSADNYNLKLKEKELELQEKELELKKKELESKNAQTLPNSKPLPPNPSGKYDTYSGTIGSTNSTFNLSWQNNLVSGTYYYNGNPGVVYTLSGTNYRQGEADIQVFNGSQLEATVKVYKRIIGNRICWTGSFYQSNGSNHPISFCRYR